MKVKDLKAILADCDDNLDVSVVDVNDMYLRIVGGGETSAYGLCLRVNQEFPVAWFDPKTGEERRWINGKGVVPFYKPEDSEISLIDYDIFGDKEEHFVYMTFEDGEARGEGLVMKYPKIASLTDEQIEEIDEWVGGRISDSGYITPNDVALALGKISVEGIMDDGQNHDSGMVREINIKWVRCRESFKPILCALYERDIDEITGANSFQMPEWEDWDEFKHGINTGDWAGYNKKALDAMVEEWDFFAHNYLMNIADDADLETILGFISRGKK